MLRDRFGPHDVLRALPVGITGVKLFLRMRSRLSGWEDNLHVVVVRVNLLISSASGFWHFSGATDHLGLAATGES